MKFTIDITGIHDLIDDLINVHLGHIVLAVSREVGMKFNDIALSSLESIEIGFDCPFLVRGELTQEYLDHINYWLFKEIVANVDLMRFQYDLGEFLEYESRIFEWLYMSKNRHELINNNDLAVRNDSHDRIYLNHCPGRLNIDWTLYVFIWCDSISFSEVSRLALSDT